MLFDHSSTARLHWYKMANRPNLGRLISASQKFGQTGLQDVLGGATFKRLWDMQNSAWDPAAAENAGWIARAMDNYPPVADTNTGLGQMVKKADEPCPAR